MSKEEIKNLLIDFVCEYDFTNWNNDKVYEKFSDLIYKQISDLEAKLAESKEEIKVIDEDRQFKAEMWTRFADKCKDLKQQLAEKEKEIELLTEEKEYIRKHKLIFEDALVNVAKSNQDKISFCIEKLKKVKKLFEEKYTYDVEESDFAVIYEDDVDEIIDNQIKEIKGEK